MWQKTDFGAFSPLSLSSISTKIHRQELVQQYEQASIRGKGTPQPNSDLSISPKLQCTNNITNILADFKNSTKRRDHYESESTIPLYVLSI